MTAPAPPQLDERGRAAWAALFGPPIAHRGLWSPEGAPENSLAAFEAGCAGGYGVELDVRLSADGEAMVFHDADLHRMTGVQGALAETSVDDLAGLRLCASDQPVPTLTRALDAIGGRTLVLVELKTMPGEEGSLESRVADLLDRYEGPAAVIGFNALSLAWFAQARPGLLRGLNAYAYADARSETLSERHRAALADFEHALLAEAHFLLPGLDVLERPAVARRRAEGLPVVAWTVRSARQAAAAQPWADNQIFEGFIP